MIDVGDYFDIAVQSLALKLNLPLIIGGTFQAMLTIDYCRGKKRFTMLALHVWCK